MEAKFRYNHRPDRNLNAPKFLVQQQARTLPPCLYKRRKAWWTKEPSTTHHPTDGLDQRSLKREQNFRSRVEDFQGRVWIWLGRAWQGHPMTIFGKLSVRKTIWGLEFSYHFLKNLLLACLSWGFRYVLLFSCAIKNFLFWRLSNDLFPVPQTGRSHMINIDGKKKLGP